jgi:acyl transferase domain-containing protein/SAM-dependent methyltransferase
MAPYLGASPSSSLVRLYIGSGMQDYQLFELTLSTQPGDLTPFEETLPFEPGHSSAVEPIAICGIALRLPGGISTPAQFWDFLMNKGDARGPVPSTRFNVSSYYSKSGKPGYVKATHGYFLDESVDLGALDTTFFTMPKQEIERADPQQRLLLEVARECLDSAGETEYRGKSIGTYIGTFGEDWLENFSKDSQAPATYKLTGYGDFVLSNRISYEYDLKGPSMTIKTGCSSALIGLHEACMAIRAGECNAAIVGGANLIMAPAVTISMSDQGVLSPDGSCKTFDATANGYARGEAINVVYIKKLSDAIRDKNPIRAIIRGTSSNADGKTAGLSVPSSECHEAMIRRAYQAAGISDFSKTGFVECHGTGTPTGDPIETTAVANVFGDYGVHIGSVKPNVGHSEGASGITSLIKSILALEHRTIPPNIKFNKPNPKIPFEEKKLKVPVEPTAWPADRCERASVNSFGIGGSNVHAILDSARSYLGTSSSTFDDAFGAIPGPQLVVFTANTADSLRRQVVNQQKYIETNPKLLNDIAYTLGARRSHLPHRAFSVVGEGIETNTSSFTKAPLNRPELVMIFTGQGAPQMGAELFGSNQVFAATIRQMDKILATLPDAPSWSIVDELKKPAETSSLHQASISQPLCTAVQIALVAALRDIGIRPYAVVGHSSGEMAAAYAAGKLSSSEAIIAAYYRGVVSGDVTKQGAMAAIGMGWEETSQYLVPGVVVACENSPSSVTISGDKDKVDQVLLAIQNAKPGCLARPLKVDKAYHSHHMKEVGDRYASLASKYVRGDSLPTDTPMMFSSVTGTLLEQADLVDARYWQSNLESPVLFRTAVANLVEAHGKNVSNGLVFLEVGPHSALAGPLRQTLSQASLDSPYSSCLVRSKNATQTFLSAVGQLWTQAVPIDFCRLTDPQGAAQVVNDLPTYPWQHDHSYLFGTRLTREWRFRKFPKHELLGIRVPESTDNEPTWRNVLTLDHAPWIRDHNIKGDVIFPCAGYVGMVGEAARQLCDEDFAGFSLRNVVIDTAMVLNNSKSMEIMTSLKRHRLTDSLDSAWYEFTVSSHNGIAWMKHCAGQVCARSSPDVEEHETPLKQLPRSVEVAKWYQALRTVGANYGPYFQGLRDVSCSTTEHISQGAAINTVHDDEVDYSLHPTKIDFFLQLFSVASLKGVARKVGKMNVPTFIEHVDVFKCDSEIDMRIEAKQTRRGVICGGGEAYGTDNHVALRMTGVRLSPLEGDASQEDQDPHAGARIFWQPDFDFRRMSSLIVPHPEQPIYMPMVQELGLLCIQECLRLLKGVETAVPHLETFRTWMQKQPPPSTDGDIKDLAAQLANTAMKPFAAGLMKILDNIVSIFKGDVEPLEVLMPDNTLTNIYDGLNLVDRKAMYQALGHYKPDMRILELGAGTGGTTKHVLEGLVGPNGHRLYSSYTYTDISAGFFVAAKERFKDYPGMKFQTLDISCDPVEQGFEPASYDLILGANVLHVTDSLKETLAGIRKLLKPDGRLYMEELCCEVKAINIIMGVLPGWWLGAPDGRPDEPYVYPERWDKELRAAGFIGADDVALDCARPNQLVSYIMAKPSVECARERRVTLLHDTASLQVTEELASNLVAAGYEVGLFDFANGLPPLENDIIAAVDVLMPFLEDISGRNFDAFRDLMARASESKSGVFWLTRSSQVNCADPRWAQMIGAARTIRGDVGLDLVTCEIDTVDSNTWSLVSKVFSKFHSRIDENASLLEQEYAIVNGEVLISRLYPVVVNDELCQAKDLSEDLSYDLVVGQYGRLNSLQWTPRANRVLIGDEVLVEPKSVGMNFKVIQIAFLFLDDS